MSFMSSLSGQSGQAALLILPALPAVAPDGLLHALPAVAVGRLLQRGQGGSKGMQTGAGAARKLGSSSSYGLD